VGDIVEVIGVLGETVGSESRRHGGRVAVSRWTSVAGDA
jgi:hypothetical protein